MNERIKELMKTAGYAAPEIASRAQLLSQLLIEEMYDFMCKATDNDGAWPTSKEVKQHFGVKE